MSDRGHPAGQVPARLPPFGWLAYGASWTETESALSLVSRCGVRERSDAVLADPHAPGLTMLRLWRFRTWRYLGNGRSAAV